MLAPSSRLQAALSTDLALSSKRLYRRLPTGTEARGSVGLQRAKSEQSLVVAGAGGRGVARAAEEASALVERAVSQREGSGVACAVSHALLAMSHVL